MSINKQGLPNVRVDHSQIAVSNAYLSMWSALEAFNPAEDRWSHFRDPGPAVERKAVADEAILAVLGEGGASDVFLADQRVFETEYARMLEGGSFEAAADPSRRFRDLGRAAANRAVAAVASA